VRNSIEYSQSKSVHQGVSRANRLCPHRLLAGATQKESNRVTNYARKPQDEAVL